MKTALSALLLMLGMSFMTVSVGCEKDSDLENAAEEVDEGMDDMADDVDDAMDDLDDMGDGVDDMN